MRRAAHRWKAEIELFPNYKTDFLKLLLGSQKKRKKDAILGILRVKKSWFCRFVSRYFLRKFFQNPSPQFSAKHQCAPLGTISGCLDHREVLYQDVWKPKFPRKSQIFRKILKFGRHEPSNIFRSGCEPSNIFRSYVLPAFQNTKEHHQSPFLCIKRVPNVPLGDLEKPGKFWKFLKFTEISEILTFSEKC